MQEDISLPAEDDAPADQERLSQKFQRELNAGLVGLVLLAVLEQADEDLYGYQIAKRLQGEAAGNTPVKQGALYPVLRQLSANGLLASRIVPSYAGPPRRYYRITDAGRAVLAEWRGIWRSTRDFVDGFTQTEGASP
ncbi:MAG TPA: PadR family transcriptional regulator [Steroidobacteraceae bacterium]|nr:PadR family transcriptional regulator [Steroidobacteraceae bacterium]